MNIQMGERHRARYGEGVWSVHTPSRCTISWHLHVFTHPETPHPVPGGFYGGSVTQACSTINPISSPLLSSEEWRTELQFQTSHHGLVFAVTSPDPGVIQEPSQNHLTRRKDSYHPGNCKEFLILVSGARAKT